MATETADRRASHRRSLKVTATASIGGVVAGVASTDLGAGPTDQIGLLVVLGVVLVELGLMRAIGIDVNDFSTKDYLYVAFMTFSLWFVTATILFTAGAPVPL